MKHLIGFDMVKLQDIHNHNRRMTSTTSTASPSPVVPDINAMLDAMKMIDHPVKPVADRVLMSQQYLDELETKAIYKKTETNQSHDAPLFNGIRIVIDDTLPHTIAACFVDAKGNIISVIKR